MSDKIYEEGHVPPALTAKTATVEQKMSIMQRGDVVTWEDFEKCAECSRSGVYSAVRSARKRLMRSHRMLFDIVVGVGVERIDDNDAAETQVPRGLNGLRRRARNITKLCQVIDVAALTDDNKVRVIGASQIAQLTEMAAGKKALKALGSAPETKTLEASFSTLQELVKSR